MPGRPAAQRKSQGILRLFAGTMTPEVLAVELGVRQSTVERWREEALVGVRSAILPREGDRRNSVACRVSAERDGEAVARLQSLNRLLLDLVRKKGVTAEELAALDLSALGGRVSTYELCRLLGVARSSYYAAVRRLRDAGRGTGSGGPDWSGDLELRSAIKRLLRREPNWGARPIHAALSAAGMKVSRRRVWRLLREVRRES